MSAQQADNERFDDSTIGASVDFVDIWSRPGQWARQRAYLFLGINLLVYAALNVFVFWTQHGRLFDFSWRTYTATYGKSLIDMLVFPLNVQDTPVLIPIFGMVMAVVIIVPILIGQLYGFRFAVVFAAIVCVLGHFPVLSIFLVACSFIAGTSKQWLSFKFGVAILSLLPIAVYFYVATRGAPAVQMKTVDPTLLYAPWVLAFLAAAGIAGAVLALARLLKYRPGGILLSMIPFFLVPVVLFTHYIGVDQLEFRLLNHRYAPDRWANVPPIDVAERVLEETIHNWRQYKVRDMQAVLSMAEEAFITVAHRLTYHRRTAIIDACEKFQREYPFSRFIPNELYIRGMAEDMRFDQRLLMEDWRLRFHADMVSSLSEPYWQRLIVDFSDSIYALPARYRLAVLYVRQGRVAEATTLLRELSDRLSRRRRAQSDRQDQPVGFSAIFARPGEIDLPPIDLVRLQRSSDALLERIEYNADDPKFGNAPLVDLMKLDPTHRKWRSNLLDLAVKYAGGKLHDNLIVMYTLTEPDPYVKKKELARYAEQFEGTDAGVLAMFELARITYELALVEQDPQAEKQALDLYRRLIQEYPRHTVARQARDELERIVRVKEGRW